MTPPSLFDEIAAADEHAVRDAYRWALAHGVETAGPDRERPCHTLMCLAVEPLLESALTTEGVQLQVAVVGDPSSFLLEGCLRRLRAASAGATRLLSTALDAHARAMGYEPAAWEDRAIHGATAVLAAPGPERVIAADAARTALLQVSAALVALTERDHAGVPGHLAFAIGYATALYMLASELLERCSSS